MLKLLNFSCSRCLFPSDHSDHFLVNINIRVGGAEACGMEPAMGAETLRAWDAARRRLPGRSRGLRRDVAWRTEARFRVAAPLP